jgi:hypothetical protein
MSALKNSWKNYILSNPDLDSSNNHFAKIKDLADPSYDFEEVFETRKTKALPLSLSTHQNRRSSFSITVMSLAVLGIHPQKRFVPS